MQQISVLINGAERELSCQIKTPVCGSECRFDMIYVINDLSNMLYTWFVDDNVGVDLLHQFLHFVP